MQVTSRRGFLKIAAAGAAGVALSPALGRAAGKTVTLLHESSFIPPFDEYMKNVLAPAYEKETGVKIVYEIISVGSSPARIASISETGTGADITMNLTLIPFLYDEKYADVGDIAEEMGKEQGGWYPAAREMAIVNGKWKAIPFCSIGQLMNWRSDWFAEVGFKYALIFLTKTKSSVRTVPVWVIAELIRGDVFYWGQLMAGALLGSIPVAIIYSFFVEHYVAGLTSGSVKG